MAELKYTPVPHDHKAFLAKARTRKGFTEAFDALALEYQVAWAARGGTGSRRHGVRSCHLPPSPVLSFSARKLKCPTLTCHRPPASTCARFARMTSRCCMRFKAIVTPCGSPASLRRCRSSHAGFGRSRTREQGWALHHGWLWIGANLGLSGGVVSMSTPSTPVGATKSATGSIQRTGGVDLRPSLY